MILLEGYGVLFTRFNNSRDLLYSMTRVNNTFCTWKLVTEVSNFLGTKTLWKEGEMVQRERALLAKSQDLKVNHKAHMVEGENWTLQALLWQAHMKCGTQNK